ncbi:hypothetical protein HWC21_gp124 [Vibrio phage VAP7]|uniref:Uncharacterized protein n=2 Tax=Vapseptimavirus VAP7 TaxID=2841303 RepID=A0A4Y5TXD7_9CAUD|nr:hypothetical protein HWC21_gp124 [Vibrio phage VAP7]AWY10128.1 hypothetical protein [Vibrio phage VP-1]QDB73306.1 hypothetical protein [Vibrio phage VAP7]UFD98202.1 hypothetical protein [Vibrio phage BX-1]
MGWFKRLYLYLFGGSKIPPYEIVDRGIEELSAFKITKGKYKDVVYLVGNVGFVEDGEGVRLSFRTQILENPRNLDLNNDPNFTKVSGDILSGFMQQEAADCKNWLYYKG